MGTEIANFDEAYARDAQRYAAEEPQGGGSFISTKSGVLSFNDEELPGNQLCAVILDFVAESTYYGAKWEEGVKSPPICYAFGRPGEELAPHESMQNFPEVFEPQHETCDGCKWNEWGSADTGRGKACQNRRRLAVIPAGMYSAKKGSRDFELDLFDDPKHFQEADLAFLKLPTTSVSVWAAYVAQLSAAHRRPPYGVVTRIYLEPHKNHQFHVKFEMLELLPNNLAATVFARHEAASRSIITPYRPFEEREEAQGQRGAVRGLRR